MAQNIVAQPAGFGTSSSAFLDASQGDYTWKEIRASGSRVDLLTLVAEMDAGNFIRKAGNVLVNGGVIVVGRLIILRGKQGQIPPGPDLNSSGDSPVSIIPSRLAGYEFLSQATIFAYPTQTEPLRFQIGEIFAIGDRSLYCIFGGFNLILASTLAAPGSGSIVPAPIAPVTMSASGIDWASALNPDQSIESQFRSMPRYDVSGHSAQ